MTSRPVLTYFDARFRGEVARWLFAQAGADYEDRRLQFDEWPAHKPSAPTGALPFLTVGDVKIGQSGAVNTYIASSYGLNGSNTLEAAQIHMIWDCLAEFQTASIKVVFAKEPETKKDLITKFKEQELPKFFRLLKSHLASDRQWLVGNKISLADIGVICILDDLKRLTDFIELVTDAIKAEPEIDALFNRVTEQPNIKKWIETRPYGRF